MNISARNIKKTKTWHECHKCYGFIEEGSSCVSAYGMAERRDKPYRIWLHHDCAEREMKFDITLNKEGKFRRRILPGFKGSN